MTNSQAGGKEAHSVASPLTIEVKIQLLHRIGRPVLTMLLKIYLLRVACPLKLNKIACNNYCNKAVTKRKQPCNNLVTIVA